MDLGPEVMEPIVAAIERSFADSASRSAMVAAIFVLAGFALSFRIPNLIFYSKDETSTEQSTE